MLLNNVQELIERSIYLSIQNVVVANQLGVISNDYPDNTVGNNNYNAAIDAITAAQGFALELFNNSSSQAKGLKRVPRIVISPGRVLAGDIGNTPQGTIERNLLDPLAFIKVPAPFETSDLHMDIHLVVNTAKQHRTLHAILAAAIGQRAYLPVYNNPDDKFFIRQINSFDLPDTSEGISEVVYTYEIKDLYLSETAILKEGSANTPISVIKEITVETTVSSLQTIFQRDGVIIGPYTNEGEMLIDLSGIKF